MVQAQVPHTDMNAEWRQFLATKVNSFVKWDLVRFFHDNPHTADTVENIAHYVGREVNAIKTELDELARSGVLIAEQKPAITIYRLAKDANMRQLIADFMNACLSRDFRVKAIRYVIESRN